MDVANSEDFQGGAEVLNDADYLEFIKNFVLSLQDGTERGLEGTARLVSGVEQAECRSELINVGELNTAGDDLKSNGIKAKIVKLDMYVAGLNGGANSSILSRVRQEAQKQLSAGEFLNVVSSTPVTIALDVRLEFNSTPDSVALSQRRDDIKAAFEAGINNLSIGENFVRATYLANIETNNNWQNLFTATVVKPSGDITIPVGSKAVAGVVSITYV